MSIDEIALNIVKELDERQYIGGNATFKKSIISF